MKDRQTFALNLARHSGEILRDGYEQEKSVRLKGANDLVTEYDLRVEKYIIDNIQERYPNDGIVAEEKGIINPNEDRWIIDPLDGTTNYSQEIPFFCVSIAYVREQNTQLGVIYDPMRDELFSAIKGEGARTENQTFTVSDNSELSTSIIGTGFPFDFRENPENTLGTYNAVAQRSRALRRLGSAALDLAYVGIGRFDAYWELGLSPWDMAAGVLIVQEAGGIVTRVDGGLDVFAEPTSLLATNGLIHEEMLSILNPT